MGSKKNDSLRFFVVICTILLIGWVMFLMSIPDDDYYSESHLENGAYILKSDAMTYSSERNFEIKEITAVMLVPIENPEGESIKYATSDKTKIPEGLRKEMSS